ncbi:hypothetical protein [Actinomadura sp. NBRC 104425]|nr:hypothetical protein [Actinomadura sp. NBRC 104425]
MVAFAVVAMLVITAALLAGTVAAFAVDRRRPRYVGRHRAMF